MLTLESPATKAFKIFLLSRKDKGNPVLPIHNSKTTTNILKRIQKLKSQIEGIGVNPTRDGRFYHTFIKSLF